MAKKCYESIWEDEDVQEAVSFNRWLGSAEGEIKGLKRGRKEILDSVTKNLLERGWSMADIIQISGLTEEDFNELKPE